MDGWMDRKMTTLDEGRTIGPQGRLSDSDGGRISLTHLSSVPRKRLDPADLSCS